jgi:putative NADH-flavin reductase
MMGTHGLRGPLSYEDTEMKVALVGATGNAGSRILRELVQRGHQVTAIVRNPGRVPALPGVTAARGDVHDRDGIAGLLGGHDAAMSSVRFIEFDQAILLDAVIRSRVPRYLVVGGAGSLEIAPGKLEYDRPDYPAAARENSKRGGTYLEMLRATKNLDWTYLSPSRKFFAGERTGRSAAAAGGRPAAARLSVGRCQSGPAAPSTSWSWHRS